MRARLIAATVVTLAVAAPLAAHAQRSGRSTDGDFGGRPSFGEEMGRKFDSMGDLKLYLHGPV